MFLPPAAAWTVDSPRWRRCVLLLLGLAGTLAGLFFYISQGWGAHTQVLVVSFAACTVGAALGLSRAAQGQLRWDGERWHWSGSQDHAVRHVDCVVDLQRWLLLRIDCEAGPSLWLWLYSPTMESRWLALRRAVVASALARHHLSSHSLPE